MQPTLLYNSLKFQVRLHLTETPLLLLYGYFIVNVLFAHTFQLTASLPIMLFDYLQYNGLYFSPHISPLVCPALSTSLSVKFVDSGI